MATDSHVKSVTNTLTSTTADEITLTQLWPVVRITNHDASTWLYVRQDGTTAVAEADGTTAIAPNTTRAVKGERAEGTNTIVVSVVGDGNTYTVEGINGGDIDIAELQADVEALNNATSTYTSDLASDVGPLTASTFTDFHSGTFEASSSTVKVTVGVGGTSTGGLVKVRAVINGTNYSLMQASSTNETGNRTIIISGLTVGNSYNWSIQYQGNGSSSWYCRPATQTEWASFIAEGATTP